MDLWRALDEIPRRAGENAALRDDSAVTFMGGRGQHPWFAFLDDGIL